MGTNDTITYVLYIGDFINVRVNYNYNNNMH